MHIPLYTLTSSIHDISSIERNSRDFLEQIETTSGLHFDNRGEDFSNYCSDEMPVIFVRTGGTESKFKEIFQNLRHSYIRLLTSGMNNSLAASMEILSFLHQQGCQGEILHGSCPYIAQRLLEEHQIEVALNQLNGRRLGVIGHPSDWLIASHADQRNVFERLGMTLIDISMDEFMSVFNDITPNAPRWQEFMKEPEVLRFDRLASSSLTKYRDDAFRIYLTLECLVNRYRFYGLTLRCFDLLSLVHNTGCMALAMLNARGIPACCEGDIPALLTMSIGQSLIGQTGFQANPARIDIDENRITFAHCTVPMNMVRSYSYDTHFESGIGIGLRGEFDRGPVTIAKVSGDLNHYWFSPAYLVDNLSEQNLCRTQIVLEGQGFADYFLADPIGNHHIIFQGDHQRLFTAFMKRVGQHKF